ncbi:class I adenylate-forming enzyme family protein [Spiribacter halobius]|uniref:Long-chain fatty acid--CoA ligase n=1 Tax=Sediminicurvatus halobius TaxID=2182432 RepID=A0A2U2MWW2_9GAMM|nr:AMP-binding protein [Spiribacter halobius]PWG61351.1 long-chain fatty acid--CoA ligase [Spiribacter halobius]UEX76734.1 AMP-binding protein [Spiribacter halobius]
MQPPEDYDRLPMDWVGDWAGRRRRLSPHREALVDATDGGRWTYAELDDRAERVGRWLTEGLGLEPGDPVCVISRNRVEPVDLYLACGKTGVVLAPLSHRLRPRELNELLRRIQPRVLCYEDAFSELVADLVLPPSVMRSVAFGPTASAWEEEVLATPAAPVNVALPMAAPYLYIHTGGSTATPKVCIVPHRQMVWNSVELVLAAPEGLAQRRELLFFPLFHIGGWNTLTPILHAGGRVVLIREFDPAEALAVIGREGINHFGGVEAMLKMMAGSPAFAEADLSSLEAITTAGAPCSAAAMAPFWDRGIAVSQSYGQTEAGPSNFINGRLDADLDTLRAHHDSIGTSFFHCDYRIVDPAQETPVPTGETGVLLLRSPHGFDGYLRQPERTDEVFRSGGWIRTGDLAREDAEGYVTIVGREDNLILSGGENVSPEEIESVLLGHPAVSAAVAFGVSDERWGEAPVVLVVAEGEGGDPEALRGWLRERLAGFKQPREIRAVAEVPLTGAGKPDRNAARASYQAMQGNDA